MPDGMSFQGLEVGLLIGSRARSPGGPPGPIVTDLKPVPTTPPPSVSHSQGSAVPPPGFLNTDWRSSFEDSNP